MTTIRHKKTGQTLEGVISHKNSDEVWFDLGGSPLEDCSIWVKLAYWEVLPEPRSLPTHDGAVIATPHGDVYHRSRGSWYGRWASFSDIALAGLVGNDWVELVAKGEVDWTHARGGP